MHIWLEDHLGYVDVNNFGTSMIRLQSESSQSPCG